MTIDAQAILDHLLGTPPLKLEDINSRKSGIYALYDHEHRPAYIGETTDFRHRIYQNHSSGDGNSHKFSTVYNAGRMFHSRKDPRTCGEDGKIAKALRTRFAREYCRAVIFEIPGLNRKELKPIEARVLSIAPAEAKRWNGRKAIQAFEPHELVDKLLYDLNWDSSRLSAILRQAERGGEG
ncbi:GIY-YIG nuclease family protein [Erythrobacter sp. SD-21]|uniref:GIY-YIG nuclease family protein n=1 Tax=Erythrobacter sp. SD-21 TaxID=161528 RepID=UPI001F317C27|nr:GIY-YIG nuclease family protein [Erythrobacter sp. SD-21]